MAATRMTSTQFTASGMRRILSSVERVPESGCWIWMKTTNGNYGQLHFHGRKELAHRASWIVHRGPIPGGMVICHRCDVRLCVNPDHLFVGTAKDNVSDMVRKGRMVQADRSGRRNPKAKLSAEQVMEATQSDEPTQHLADRFGVAYQTVWRIRKGIGWRGYGRTA